MILVLPSLVWGPEDLASTLGRSSVVLFVPIMPVFLVVILVMGPFVGIHNMDINHQRFAALVTWGLASWILMKLLKRRRTEEPQTDRV